VVGYFVSPPSSSDSLFLLVDVDVDGGYRCQQTSSGKTPSIVSGTAVSTSGRTEWQVIAHEIGHNFGAIHDVGNLSLSDRSLLLTPCLVR
jgi:hypothetical protein